MFVELVTHAWNGTRQRCLGMGLHTCRIAYGDKNNAENNDDDDNDLLVMIAMKVMTA